MIIGIGVDIVEIRRIKAAIDNNKAFSNKVFTDNELKYLEKRGFRPEYAAGRFAAKEAVAKALGTGFRGFGLRDIEITNNELGMPLVTLEGEAKRLFQDKKAINLHLSISHGEDNAVAYVILEG